MTTGRIKEMDKSINSGGTCKIYVSQISQTILHKKIIKEKGNIDPKPASGGRRMGEGKNSGFVACGWRRKQQEKVWIPSGEVEGEGRREPGGNVDGMSQLAMNTYPQLLTARLQFNGLNGIGGGTTARIIEVKSGDSSQSVWRISLWAIAVVVACRCCRWFYDGPRNMRRPPLIGWAWSTAYAGCKKRLGAFWFRDEFNSKSISLLSLGGERKRDREAWGNGEEDGWL